MTKFENLTEEEKRFKIYGYAYARLHSVMSLDLPGMDDYKQEVQAMINWINKETGLNVDLF